MTHTPVPRDRTGPGLEASTQLAEFRARCEVIAGRPLTSPADLHDFSVSRGPEFWTAFLAWSGLPHSGSPVPAVVGHDVETARFFPGVTLNYAEVLLRRIPGVPDDAPAVTAVHRDRPAEHLDRAELRAEVTGAAAALAGLGVHVGDRVSVIAPNDLTLMVSVLAAAAIGATVSTAAPDMGSPALLGRLAQTTPAVLLLSRAGMDEAALRELVDGLPTLRALCLLDEAPVPRGLPVHVHRLVDLARDPSGAAPEWPRLPFDHPLFVMFSSGTTGPPKAIVHGAGGTLLEHVKEHRLHGDLRPTDTLFFHTTAAWMMWNWQLSALAVGAHVVVNDGPVLGPDDLWDVAARQRVTVFGTSPAYLQLCQDAGHHPARVHDLRALRCVLSTGAVLHKWQFEWLADELGPVPLQSISGGTDIIGCFLLGHPESAVVPGRVQTTSLGLDVAALDGAGRAVLDHVGELVCRSPFPSRPVGFLRDPGGERFHRAYFVDHPGVWTHGDLVELAADGSARVLGRSDGVMNVNGIRIGPAEVYTALHGVPAVSTAMAVEQRDPEHPGQSRMVLLVVLADGYALDARLEREIRRTVRTRASAAHVPALVLAVTDLPTTHSGKPSERAARDAVNGDPVANTAALRNPGSLDEIRTAVSSRTSPTEPIVPAPVLQSVERLDPAGDSSVEQLWSDVLGVPTGDPQDDFFDLGGDSRQLMSLVHRVRTEAGIDLPTVEFFRDPTLGTLVRAAAERDRGTRTLTDEGPGTGQPVFLVSLPWSTTVDRDAALALVTRSLGHTPPRFSVVPSVQGTDTGEDLIARLVQAVLDDVRSARGSGACRLAGLGPGAAVALSVATALRAVGEVVSGVDLVAATPPVTVLDRLTRLRQGWQQDWSTLRAPDRKGRLWARFVDRYAPATTSSDHQDRLRVESALARHRPTAYDGPVRLHAWTGSPVDDDALAAWRRVAPRAVNGRSGPAAAL